ncbi:unnamed protein product [Bursaphelenchus okinawaensis]|uniref:PDZ domain-containing protein n=1 Tax=Bursaphelenchus okinawaensis TaxID=465554 RepID=A0A811KT05_9BILA|nr:unnamed protein product [Bursaphelenchus okinawaensis]CAG9112788.1 unnamed protein product [Bursaphelenchus okinawaensis]
MNIALPQDAPSPRICRIQKTHSDDEYGFNLHAEKSKGQYVGSVDGDSPADHGGLKKNDRIVGVNGELVIGIPHKEVVQKIKVNPLFCELFVLSEPDFLWYQNNQISITYDLPNIVRPVSEKPAEAPVAHRAGTPPMTPRPLLCQLKKTSPNHEFGFNLHAERNKGHFIGSVDKGGIADFAGLETGQRIVGVNGQLIYPSSPHKAIVALIKRDPLDTSLLVASEDVDRWYTENGIPYSFDVAKVHRAYITADLTSRTATISSHRANGTSQGYPSASSFYTPPEDAQTDSVYLPSEAKEDESRDTSETSEVHESDNSVSSEVRDLQNVENAAVGSPDDLLEKVFSSVPPPREEQNKHVINNYNNTAPLAPISVRNSLTDSSPLSSPEKDENVDIFKMSAKKARELLKPKKRDLRVQSTMTLEEKHQLIANL